MNNLQREELQLLKILITDWLVDRGYILGGNTDEFWFVSLDSHSGPDGPYIWFCVKTPVNIQGDTRVVIKIYIGGETILYPPGDSMREVKLNLADPEWDKLADRWLPRITAKHIEFYGGSMF